MSKLLNTLVRDIRESGKNIFSLALVQDAEQESAILLPTCNCQNCFSVTKAFAATAIGLLQDDGLLSVNDLILKYFAKELPETYDPRLERVQIRHLLSQTMGNESGYLFETDRYTHAERNWVRLVLSQPLAYEPGTRFSYSSSTYYLLGCIVRRVAGISMEYYLRERLFSPLNIDDYAWSACPCGETLGGTGLYLSTPDLLKFGMLYRDGGVYGGRRILSEEWVHEATRNQVNLPDAPVYGYSFWGNPLGYEGGGAHSQVVLVYPERNIVFAAHAYDDDINYAGLLEHALETSN